MSSLPAKADYTVLDLIINFKHNLWSKMDQPSLPLCDPSVEIRSGAELWVIPDSGGVKKNGSLFSTIGGAGAAVTRGNEVIDSLGLASNKLP